MEITFLQLHPVLQLLQKSLKDVVLIWNQRNFWEEK